MDVMMEAMFEELEYTLGRVDKKNMKAFAELVNGAPRVFLAGCGRSGLMVRAFAMRVMHLGKMVYMLGDVTTPSIHTGDLLIIASGSGETESLVSHAKKAKKLGAKVATITIYPQASIGKMADCTVQIDAPTAKTDQVSDTLSVQPMGSLFEQSLLLFLDYTVIGMMEISGKTSEKMFENHANLE